MKTLSPERARQARRLFEELIDSAEPEGAARVAALRESDPEIAAAVLALLEADRAAEGFLEKGPAELTPELFEDLVTREEAEESDASGERVGPWRLLRLLGRGGMGEVYLAERTDGEYEHRAALKLLKPGMDSEAIRRRFLRERQVLAGLQHPNIARLLDGGTAEGRPYFVLELVEGESVLDYCRRKALPLDERLRLMIDCCEAVEAAHRRLVVHRDLKPNNILVTADGQLKLLDFGIAKLLSEEASESTQLTHVEERVLTPAYAAPEQILGEPVTTATDVFSLGVVFYQMLTGVLPHRRGNSAAELASRIHQETVERPSRAVSRAGSEESGFDAKELARLPARLSGDLDSILLTALRREPERRYPSAAALGEDLRRHRQGRPVAARPDTLGYRAGKFIRRHRAGVAAAALVLLALVAGLAGTVWQARRAEANARQASAEALRANRVKEFLIGLFEVADPEQSGGGTITAKELIEQAGRRLDTELGSEPEVQADLLEAVSRIHRTLGIMVPAQALAEKSLAIRSARLPLDDPAIGRATAALGSALLFQGKLDEAEKKLRSALAILEKHEAADPLAAARARSDMGQLLFWRDKRAESAALEERAYETYRRELGANHIQTAIHQRNLCVVYESLDRLDEAEKTCRESQGVLERALGPEHPNVGQSYAALAFLLDRRGKVQEADALYRRSLAVRSKALGDAHVYVGQTHQLYAVFLLAQGRLNESEEHYKKALAIFTAIDPKHFEVGKANNGLALIAAQRGDFAKAEAMMSDVEALFRAVLGEQHPFVWQIAGNRSDQIAAQGRLEEAATLQATVVAKLDELTGADSQRAEDMRSRLGSTLRRLGRPAEAEPLQRRALEVTRKLQGGQHTEVALQSWRLGQTLAAKGDAASRREARGLYDRATKIYRGPPPSPRLGEVLLSSGNLALEEGDPERARRELTESARLLATLWGEADRRAREARNALAAARERRA